MRRLRNAPRVMSVVATLGVGQFLVLFAFAINGQAGAGALYPQPPGLPEFNLGALRRHAGLLGHAVPLAARRHRGRRVPAAEPLRPGDPGRGGQPRGGPHGRHLRRAHVARWRGRSPAVLAAFTAILTQPTRGFTGGDSRSGRQLLLVASPAPCSPGMQASRSRCVAGIGVGVVEQLLLWNYAAGRPRRVVLFVIILVALLLQRRAGRSRRGEGLRGRRCRRCGRCPRRSARLRSVRRSDRRSVLVALVGFAVLPSLITNANSVKLTGIVRLRHRRAVGRRHHRARRPAQPRPVRARCGRRGGVVPGVAAHRQLRRAFLYAGLAAAAVSVLIGLPALRIKGLLLTVTTLASRS